MKLSSFIVITISSIFLNLTSVQSQTNTIAHYLPGLNGAISYAAAPEVIEDISGNGNELIKNGSPVFFATAPAHKMPKGNGSVLFNGKSDWYELPNPMGKIDDNFCLEVWVKPHKGNLSGIHSVVTNGNRDNGYLIAQQGDMWITYVGGVGQFPITGITEDQWIHLALVADGENCISYVNGFPHGFFKRPQQLDHHFYIGSAGDSSSAFNGEIHEVRYSTFEEGRFLPETDFLLDIKIAKEINQHEIMLRKARISQLLVNQQGVRSVKDFTITSPGKDWLVDSVQNPVELLLKMETDTMSARIMLTNGLVTREFYISDNLATVEMKNLSNDAQYVRAIKPEAKIMIDSIWYDIGGLKGQPEASYILESWYNDLKSGGQSFKFEGMTTSLPHLRYPWQQKFNATHTDWPPKGLHVIFDYIPQKGIDDRHKKLIIKVHYEMYEGLPLIAKWLTIHNQAENRILINETECEVLAVTQDQLNRLHVESDYSFGLVNGHPNGSSLLHYKGEPKPYHAGRSTTIWKVDEEYNTWATHNPAEDGFLNYPHHNLLMSRLPMGPNAVVESGENFKSIITFELFHDSDDKERQSLAHRRMYRKLAPQVTESLLAGAITSHDEMHLKLFIDQMSELGFERLDIHPWPGVDHDNLDPQYIAHWKKIAEYARKHGIIMGAYELQVASRSRGSEYDCIDPISGKPGSLFGQSVCIASDWKDIYYPKTWDFFDQTGFMSYNMDGPYHGDACASKVHKYHHGLRDSQWQQWKTQIEVLHELQRRNMYVPIPDWYFLNGQSVTGMGYREASANLTPQQQLLLGRQYIYDGTWHKIPTMGWMTLQLVGFYTNDKRVGLEPLSENLDRYERGLIQYLASGCQFSVRGNRLYDTPETKEMVKKWINWFKKYRNILTSDLIHVGRPTGRDPDCMLHVNAELDTRGLAIVFNPTNKVVKKKLKLPLYYTGIDKCARIKEQEGEYKNYNLDRDFKVEIPVEINANGYTWFVIEDQNMNEAKAINPTTPRFIQMLKNGENLSMVTIGTSLTDGDIWVDKLESWLNSKYPGNIKIYNHGIGASASTHPTNPELNGLYNLPAALKHTPNVVLIEYATNDAFVPYEISLEQSRKNLHEIIRHFERINPDVEIILQTMNCVIDDTGPHATDRPNLASYFEMYREEARKNDYIFIDHYKNWLHLRVNDFDKFKKYVPDGIHPNNEGQIAIMLPEFQMIFSY